MVMKTKFTMKANAWTTPWPERISKYDIVCQSPPLDPMQGLPIGNGDIGALVWCEPRKLVIAVNKCDLWDDSPNTEDGGQNKNAPHWVEKNTTLRHACRLELDLISPLMDTWYLEDFEARLDIARGLVNVRSVTPLGVFKAKIFISSEDKALHLHYRFETKEAIAPEITMERWGTRAFFMWYLQSVREPSIGLDGTNCEVADNLLMLHQELQTMNFVVAAKVVNDNNKIKPVRSHSRAGIFKLPQSTSNSGKLALTVQNSEEVENPLETAKNIVGKAMDKSQEQTIEDHTQFWQDFWVHTYFRIDDLFLENLWHLAMYYAASSQRGRYPGMFTQGLWGWNRDFQPWGCYYQWNQQQMYWAVPAAGHPELMKPFLEYRHNILDKIKYETQKIGETGAHYEDTSDRLGNQIIRPNRTPGGQIVADFWRYYRYSGDADFLREKGWPITIEVAKFHYSLLEKHEDGLFHTNPGWGYEGGNLLKDCITELVTTKQVFEITLSMAKLFGHTHPDLELWQEALENLAPYPIMESPINPRLEIFAAGYQKGHYKNADKHFCGGMPFNDDEEWENPQLTCAHDPRSWAQIFSDVETSVVFPSGKIGLKDKGSRDFELAVNTAKETEAGWTKAIVYARLGMREELADILANFYKKKENTLGKSEYTCTGFSAHIPHYWQTNMVADPLKAPEDFEKHDTNGPAWDEYKASRVPMRMWEYRRIGQERIYLLASALTESMIQSFDDTIRIAPANNPNKSFAFTLFAEGGFKVSAAGHGESVDWVHITSLRGENCKVINPWPDKQAWLHSLFTESKKSVEGNIINFETSDGTSYLLAPFDTISDQRFESAFENTGANKNPISAHENEITIGIPKMF